jgi:hypothetical protein
MQAKASRLSFQVKSAAFSIPNVSDASRFRVRPRASRARLAEDEVEGPGEHVQVLGMGHVGDEAVDEENVEPPADLDVEGDRGGGQTRRGEDAGQGGAQERQTGRLGMEGDGERLEVEVAERHEGEGYIDDR